MSFFPLAISLFSPLCNQLHCFFCSFMQKYAHIFPLLSHVKGNMLYVLFFSVKYFTKNTPYWFIQIVLIPFTTAKFSTNVDNIVSSTVAKYLGP